MNTEITGAALKVWRDTHNKNLEEVGQMLGGVSGPTISRWESGQDIPGPAQLLLGMLIYGAQPFGSPEDTSAEEAKHFWQLKLTLADWHKLEALATAGGFATVRDYLLSLIREHLEAEPPAGRSARAPADDLAMVSETPAVYGASKKGAKA